MTEAADPAAAGMPRGWLWAVRLAALAAIALVVARAVWLLGYRQIASLRPWVLPAVLLDALALLPYLAVLLLLARAENRKRGLALAMAWGALACAAALAPYWPALRDILRNLLPGRHAIVHHYFAGTRFLLDRLDALAGLALVVLAARTWAARARARDDFRMVLWGISFAVLYFALLRLLVRMLIPGNLPGILP
jgi:hypothetical protein